MKHCVYADEKLYTILNETNIYEVVSKGDVTERKVKTLVSKLVEASFKNMTEEQQDYIQNCKSFERVKSSYGVKDYYDELIEYISDNKIKMDENTKYQLHFLNGYVDLKTGEIIENAAIPLISNDDRVAKALGLSASLAEVSEDDQEIPF